jgi:hypothetical protein
MKAMQRFWVYFQLKSNKEYDLFSNFSFQILVDYPFWVSTYTKQARLRLTFIKIIPSIVTLLTLCGRRNKQSQFSQETDDSESNFNPCKVNLTHTLGTPIGCSEANVCLSFRVVKQGHHKRL